MVMADNIAKAKRALSTAKKTEGTEEESKEPSTQVTLKVSRETAEWLDDIKEVSKFLATRESVLQYIRQKFDTTIRETLR